MQKLSERSLSVRCRSWLALGTATMCLYPTLAYAQSAASDGATNTESGLSEIIVTAQKRAEKLQDVPVAISAVSGDNLKAVGITRAEDLKYTVSGLSFERAQYAFHPRIRGVGTVDTGPGVENSVAVYVDGVYFAAGGGTNVDFNDAERVEVLKGPQGTLFGRNATGGAINIITKKPSLTEAEGAADVSYGNYETIAGNFYMSTPLSEKVGISLALQGSRQGKGYGKNLFDNSDFNRNKLSFSSRFKMLFAPTDETEITVAVDYSRRKLSYAYAQAPGAPITQATIDALAAAGLTPAAIPSNNLQRINQDFASSLDVEDYGASLTIQHDMDIFQIKSITAGRRNSAFSSGDLDLAPLNIYTLTGGPTVTKQFSQELQLLSPTSSRLKWILGAYYFWSDYGNFPFDITYSSGPRTSNTNFLDYTTQVRAEPRGYTSSWSGFGQATYDILPETNLTLGLRYTSESRKRRGQLTYLDVTAQGVAAQLGLPPTNFLPVPLSGNVKFSKLTWRIALDHHFNNDVMAYASYNRGFKSGGFQLTAPSAPFQPEVLDAYEVGLKTELFDRRLRFNIAGFYYSYKDLQVSVSDGVFQSTLNGAKARVYGTDIDIEASVTRDFTLTAAVEYAPNKFTNYKNASCFNTQAVLFVCDATGAPLPESPEFTASVGAYYTLRVGDAGALKFSAIGYHQSSTRKTPRAFLPNGGYYGQGGYSTLSGSIQWSPASDAYFVKLFGNNLTNEKYGLQTEVIGTSPGSPSPGSYYQWAAPPRTYGVQVGIKW